MSSLGSVQARSVISTGSTAQVANGINGLLTTKQTIAGSNKMKFEMPPRPAKTNNRSATPSASSANSRGGGGGGGSACGGSVTGSGTTAAAAGGAPPPRGGGRRAATADDASVPHVVRVTFLGVAGLLARKHSPDGNVGPPESGAQHAEGDPPITAAATRPASSEHPSLLFPLPPHLRVVASVSRSRTARGIPSGMSRRLAPPNQISDGGDDGGPDPRQALSPLSTAAVTGNFSSPSPVPGESIVVEKQPSHPRRSTGSRNRSKLSIEEISIAQDPSALAEPSDRPDSVDGGTGRGGSRRRRSGSRRSFSPTRGPSPRSRTGSRASGASSAVSRRADTPPGGPTEGIEVIRPCSPTEGGILGGARRALGLGGGKSRSPRPLDEGARDLAEDGPERFVAVWDEGGGFRPPSQINSQQQQQQQHQFVNLTNSLAFEAELRPSSVSVEGRPGTPSASMTFAPKSFCVSIGLVPDFEPLAEVGEDASHILEDLGETRAASASSPTSATSSEGGAPPQPLSFAIPVGFADLVINGGETLDGRRKQFDLPLSSLVNFAGLPPPAGGPAEGRGAAIPLIELTAEGPGGAAGDDGRDGRGPDAPSPSTATTRATGRPPRKRGIVKRMFSRKGVGQGPPAPGASVGGTSAPSARAYDGDVPRSVFQLGRAPNAAERALFLDRYGVDPRGDAVVRVGLEVFRRGSELEKVFRQKNKLRRRAAALSAAGGGPAPGQRAGAGRGGGRPGGGRFSPTQSLGSRTRDTADSRSLMDDEDEDDDFDDGADALDSEFDDDDSFFSQSFFTLDSDASRTTWGEESTMYTDALSSFNTMDDDSMSYTTGFTEYDKARGTLSSKRGSGGNARADAIKTSTTGLLLNLLNCNGPSSMACGVEEEEEEDVPTMTTMPMPAPYANTDAVAGAVASMGIAASAEESDTPRAQGAASRGVASADTADRTNNARETSPDESMKERGEELTLVDAAVGDGGRGGGVPALSPLETSFSMDSRAKSAITIQNETSPLATIKQRFAESVDYGERDKSRRRGRRGGAGRAEEGHEFTLEEHQSM